MKAAKRAVFAVAWVVVLPFTALAWIEKRAGAGERLFVLGAHTMALMPGFVGNLLRAAFYRATLDDAHWETNIGFGSVFSHREVRLGANVSTGSYCMLGHVDIGERTRLASRVSIPSGKRQHLDEQGGISHGETVFTQVRIGADCWLGEGAIVLDDIGEASIVAAGAVVGHAMPGGVLIGGNPAKVLRALPGPGDAAVPDGPSQARSETAASDGPVRDRADTVASDAPLHARADTSAPDAPAHARTASDADAEAVFEVPRTGGSA